MDPFIQNTLRVWEACYKEACDLEFAMITLDPKGPVLCSVTNVKELDDADEQLRSMLQPTVDPASVPHRLLVTFVILNELLYRADDENTWSTIPNMKSLSWMLGVSDQVLNHLWYSPRSGFVANDALCMAQEFYLVNRTDQCQEMCVV